MTETTKRWLTRGVVTAFIAGLAIYGWQEYSADGAIDGIASGNGRVEAVEIDIAAKAPGRVAELFVREGDFVTAGQPMARIDVEVLRAQHRAAEAQLQQALSSVATARNQFAQRQSEKATAEAVVAQRKVEVGSAQRQVARSQTLVEKGFVSRQSAEDAASLVGTAEAALNASRASRGGRSRHRDRPFATARRGVGRDGGARERRARPGRYR